MNNISNCLNTVKHEIEIKMNANIVEMPPTSLTSDKKKDIERLQETQDTVTLCNKHVSIALLKESTGQGYDRLRKVINHLLSSIGIDYCPPNDKTALNKLSLPVEAIDIEVDVAGDDDKQFDRKRKMIFG